MTNNGLLIVFPGPSGAGKDTVLQNCWRVTPTFVFRFLPLQECRVPVKQMALIIIFV